jgi:hypothetical protein
MNMMMNQTLVVLSIVLLAVLSGCSRSNNPDLASPPDTSTKQQASQPDDSKSDTGGRKETDFTEVKPGKVPGKPNCKDRLLERVDFVFDGVTLEEFVAAHVVAQSE